MAFNPNEHLMKLQTKDYLEVKWRLVWFRELCPSGTIETEIVMLDLDREVTAELMLWNDELRKKVKTLKTAKGYCVCRAIVKDGKGGIGTGTKSESAVDFGDFIEKAESGAIGRALATLGYGTQFTGDELDERHRIVDSPVDREATPATSARTTNNQRTERPATTTNAAPATPRTQPTRPAATPASAKTTSNQESFNPAGSIEDALNNMYATCTKFAGMDKGSQLFDHIKKTVVGDKRDVSIAHEDLVPMWGLVNEYEAKYKAAKEARAAKQLVAAGTSGK